MSKRRKRTNNKYIQHVTDIIKGKKFKSCMTCENCVCIGEGDHICTEMTCLVLCEYEPSEDYFKCGGKYYNEN